jgi:hypothetical protein
VSECSFTSDAHAEQWMRDAERSPDYPHAAPIPDPDSSGGPPYFNDAPDPKLVRTRHGL